ncbi:hypothetical protein VTN77DRAFT_2077 [Rasamsonia byssochlamydoides]|uniref:uncharacterized protein n=1 Tax=Rasamsonia byssochlamydoides TaxID=89139 RepID=UPI0037435AEC
MADPDIPARGKSERSESPNGPQKVVRRRQRQTLSCLPCRRLKVKCDRQQPCGHCIWSERAASCRYAPFPRNTVDSKSPADRSPSEEQVKAPKAITPPVIQPKPRPFLLPKRPESLNGDSEVQSPSVSDSTSSKDSDVSSRREENQSNFLNLNVAWKSKFRGATHWSNVLREVRSVLHDFDPSKPFFNGTYTAKDPCIVKLLGTTRSYFCSSVPSLNYPLGLGYQSHCPAKDEILTYVPDRTTTVSLIENYLQTIERTHPLLHVPTFWDELSRFWANPAAVDDGWLAQLLVMLALGYEASEGDDQVSTSKDTEEEVLHKFLRGAETCLKSTPFLFVPNLTTLRTLCMMVLAKRTTASSCLELDSCGPLMATVVRLAMSIGLHCDPRDDDNISPFEKEIRRRLWTTIVFMEIQMSISTGMPLLLRSSDFDTRPPENINDADLSPSIPQHLSIRPSMEYTDSTFQIILARSFDIAIDAVSRANSPAGVFEYDQVLRYGAEIKQLLHETSLVYDWSPSATKEDWKYLQKFTLEIFLRRVLLVLHSYYGQKPEAHLHYPVSYWSTLECSLALLVLQRQMSEDLSSPKTRVWLAEFLKHDFYIATLIVCLQVARNDALGIDETGGMHHQGIEMPPRQTILQTLQCCREIWARRICRSHCHFMIHLTIGRLIAKLESQDQKKFSSRPEQMVFMQDSLEVLKNCQCGNCKSRSGTMKDFYLSPMGVGS